MSRDVEGVLTESTSRGGAFRKCLSDVGFAAAALLFGAVSLSYPFGRDQALYGYVAREWVQRGAIPYRDVYDHKTPGIYLVHAITVLLFGSTTWGIRIADFVCVGTLGCLAARLATPRSSPIPRGLRGLGILTASVCYFGYFDFWATAQSEIWYTTLGVAAITAIARDPRETRGQLVAGALAAAALVMKPPAIWMVFIAFGVLAQRAREQAENRSFRTVVGLLRFAASAVAVVAMTLGYFGIHHALGAMADIVVGANGYYVAHERGVQSIWEALARCTDPLVTMAGVLVPTVIVLCAFAISAHRDGDVERRRRLMLGLVLVAAAYLAVGMQQKFYWLHWGVIVGPMTVLVVMVMHELMGTPFLQARIRRAPLLLAALFFTAYATTWSGGGPYTWACANIRAVAFWSGRMTREQYAREFQIDYLGYRYDDVDDVNRWLLAHLAPDDETIAVRGFNPEIYIYTGRRYVGRFFWTTFLVEPHRAYRREDYLAEDDAAFKSAPPRYVVTLSFVHSGIDSTEYYVPLGYHEVVTFRTLSILERN